MKHLISPNDLGIGEIEELLSLGKDIYCNPSKYRKYCEGKKIATLFFEPSTRTRLSFESAMMELGGDVLSVASADSSSAVKGESIADTIRVIESFADICAIRHPKEGAAKVAAINSRIPVINAGDGGHQHPTQTLTDIFTIHMLKNNLENMTIGLCGDLQFGRTVHSLVEMMSRFKNNKFVLISPVELTIPDYIKKDILLKGNIEFVETSNLEESISGLDILYMTRVQRERFFNEADYIRLKDTYILDSIKLKKAKKDMIILHPLPRVNEISVEVDKDPRACYFKQVLFGKFIRMALIIKMLEGDK